MSREFKTLAIAVYGLAVVASGLLSLLAKEPGKAGLLFGLVMGALALGASLLCWLNQRIAGLLAAWLAVGFVGGWSIYDVFVKKGVAQAEFRVYVLIVVSFAVAVVLCWPTRRSQNSETEGDSSAPPLRVENLTKRFRQGSVTIEALRDVTLTVNRGEFVAIMGASGSGKSTLLHLIAGLTTPDTGRVEVEGIDLFAMSDRELTLFRRRRIGLVFQAYNLVPSLTAEQNAMLPILMESSNGRSDKRLADVLKRLGLSDRRKHRPDQLSGGEQQRVAIARALATDPAIILADEPTGNLDSVAGQDICRLLRGLCDDQGRTIVMVTHEAAVAVWASRVVVLKDGRLIDTFQTSQFGDADALATHYQNVVAATQVSEVSG